MTSNNRRRGSLGTALGALALGLAAATAAVASPASAQPVSARPSESLNLSAGTGTLVRLSAPMSDVFVANDTVADVQVRSATQLYVFGKGRGETTVYATDKAGRVVYAANVVVGNNFSSVDEMLRLAMPDAQLQATTMNNLVLLTGTAASPEDTTEAARLVKAFVGPGTEVVNRIRTATPLQVNLRVRIAEVNRTLLKQIGVNLFTSDSTGGTGFSVNRGDIFPISNGFGVQNAPGGTTLGIAGKLLGLDVIGALDLAVTDGLVTVLAEPNLTAISGETASFLAGGEFPIPVSQALGSITFEYKQYGVGLAFTPIVLADGRISMRVRPEVSELSEAGAIVLNNFRIPALVTRRAETTVELGSGQSFMIAGLLRNTLANSVNRAPILGDLPIIGSLFRSTKFQRDETELVIVVTPYLVRPVSGRMALPTDGLRAPSDVELQFEGKTFKGVSGPRPPRAAPAPGISIPIGAAPVAAPGFKM